MTRKTKKIHICPICGNDDTAFIDEREENRSRMVQYSCDCGTQWNGWVEYTIEITRQRGKAMTEKREKSQNALILDWLSEGNTITPIQALNMFGCFRLGARIFNLRQAGHKIDGKRVKVGDGVYVQEYKMEKQA